LAVTSNNIVTINKDQNVFDSKKKMKTALSENTDSKLSKAQRETILFNNFLLLLHTNQSDSCRKQLEELKKKYPEAISEAILLEAALLCKEQKVTDAIKLLKQSSEKSPGLVLEVTLVLSQLLIKNGDISESCRVLRSLGEVAYKPGITSTLVTLYLSLGDKESATNLLTEAVQWYEKNKV
jgi:signal recognition particle subunit SRP72